MKIFFFFFDFADFAQSLVKIPIFNAQRACMRSQKHKTFFDAKSGLTFHLNTAHFSIFYRLV